MRAVITRVSSAKVVVDGAATGEIGSGFLILLGVGALDDEGDARYLCDRICKLRVFENDAGRMNISPKDAGASFLVVSNFTLYADTARSRRPDFMQAAPPQKARQLYELFAQMCRQSDFEVKTGVFGADMKVSSANDGPVTILIDTQNIKDKGI